MQVSKIRDLRRQPAGATGGVTGFAAEVVARLVSRAAPARVVLQEGLLRSLGDLAQGGTPSMFEVLKSDLRRARVSAGLLADGYIPEVARRMGSAWESDRMSFAEVTMAVARLQLLLREIGGGWSADGGAAGGGAAPGGVKTILMIVPEAEQHTLGALVVMGQLRRRGISVCLRIAPSEADLRSLFGARGFDAAMISVAGTDLSAACARLVTLLKRLGRHGLPVALGGSLLTGPDRALCHAGADIVTNDLDHALAELGLCRSLPRMLERA